MSFLNFLDLNLLGQVSLDISTGAYLIWFLPQLFLNFKRHSTHGLSLSMHGLLCVGYLCDLVYGFGLGMQWQYRLITGIGLMSLCIQNYQFLKYGILKEGNHEKSRIKNIYFIFLNLIFLSLIIFALHILIFSKSAHSFYPRSFYDDLGMVANICWFTYMIPQIIKNYFSKSTLGLSPYFVLIALFLNLCDSTSAWALDWDYPSKIGPMTAFAKNLILIFQVGYYAKFYKK